MIAMRDEIIASVEPQQTVISRSGSTVTPWVRANFSTIASRRGFAPQVMAYWLSSAAMAARAASLTSAGAGKSGNPCARLTASYCKAKRVISRITDSVKYSAFSESIKRAVLAILSGVGLASAGLVIRNFRKRERVYGRTPDGKGDVGAVSEVVSAEAVFEALASVAGPRR